MITGEAQFDFESWSQNVIQNQMHWIAKMAYQILSSFSIKKREREGDRFTEKQPVLKVWQKKYYKQLLTSRPATRQ